MSILPKIPNVKPGTILIDWMKNKLEEVKKSKN